ncbi:hypothetical protein Tco_0138728 [Tanacetum coccineum]
MAEEQAHTNMALMGFLDSEVYNDKSCTKTCLKNYETLKKQCDDLIVKLNQTEFASTTYKIGLATVENQLITYRKNEALFSEEVAVLKREVACKDYKIDVLKKSQITDKSKKGLGYNVVPPPHPLIYNGPTKLDLSYSGLDEFKDPEFKSYGSKDSKQKSNQLGSDFVMYNKACFICGSLDHVQAHCKYLQKERMVYGNNYNMVNYNYTTNKTHPNAPRNMVPRAVLMKTGLKPFNTAKTVNTAHPKSIVFNAKPMSRFSKLAQSTVRRPYQSKTVLSNKKFTQTNNIVKAKAVNTARPKAVNTARPYTKPVNVVREKRVNAVKTSACWVWRPTKPNGASLAFKRHNYIDARDRSNGCSRHMTGNIAYLLDFKEFNGGYVTFGEGAHGGRISGKGTLKIVGDEAIHEELGDRMERAATTASSLKA